MQQNFQYRLDIFLSLYKVTNNQQGFFIKS